LLLRVDWKARQGTRLKTVLRCGPHLSCLPLYMGANAMIFSIFSPKHFVDFDSMSTCTSILCQNFIIH
jgi:hypothetical protein